MSTVSTVPAAAELEIAPFPVGNADILEISELVPVSPLQEINFENLNDLADFVDTLTCIAQTKLGDRLGISPAEKARGIEGRRLALDIKFTVLQGLRNAIDESAIDDRRKANSPIFSFTLDLPHRVSRAVLEEALGIKEHVDRELATGQMETYKQPHLAPKVPEPDPVDRLDKDLEAILSEEAIIVEPSTEFNPYMSVHQRYAAIRQNPRSVRPLGDKIQITFQA